MTLREKVKAAKKVLERLNRPEQGVSAEAIERVEAGWEKLEQRRTVRHNVLTLLATGKSHRLLESVSKND